MATKRMLIYSLGAEARRQSVVLSNLSWECAHRVTPNARE